MMSKGIPAFIIVTLLFVNRCVGQTFSIIGILKDSTGLAIHNATVILDNNIAAKITVSDSLGQFEFKEKPMGTYSLKISCLGFKSIQKRVVVTNKAIDLGEIILTQVVSVISEVKIIRSVVGFEQKADTIEFNAIAYKVVKDASSLDLLSKIPGIEISSNKVKAQGETVIKVILDGKPFFGDDPITTLKTLPAEMVEKVQIYDQKNDQAQFTGFDDGNSFKTINIVSKASMRRGKFGTFMAGYGNSGRYQASSNLSIFNGVNRLSVVFQSNNVNGVNSDKGDGNFGTKNDVSSGGISKTNTYGVNYSNNWNKLSISSSYLLNTTNNENAQFLLRHYFLPSKDTSLLYSQNNILASNSIQHRINTRFDYIIDSFNSLLFHPIISLQQNTRTSSLEGETSAPNHLINQVINYNKTSSFDINLSSCEFLFRHRFRKVRRTFSIDLNGSYSNNEANNNLNSKNSLIDSGEITQNSRLYFNGMGISSNVAFTEPLGKRAGIQFNWVSSYNENRSDKLSYDVHAKSEKLDTALTNNLVSRVIVQTPGISVNLPLSKALLSIGLNYQMTSMINDQSFYPQYYMVREYRNLLPYMKTNYKLSKSKSFEITCQTRTSQPSLFQLQEVINNYNPLQLSSGNPKLKQSYTGFFKTKFTATNKASSNVFMVTMGVSSTYNYIATSNSVMSKDSLISENVIALKGAQISKPVNLSGYFNPYANVTYSVALMSIKSRINFSSSYNYRQIPSMVNNIKNYSFNNDFSFEIMFNSNFSDKLEFMLSSNISGNYTINSLNTNSRISNYANVNKASFYWMIWNGFILKSDLYNQINSGLTLNNKKITLWSVSLGKKIFKNKQGEIRFFIFDLLKQNNNLKRNVTSTYYEDFQTQTLQQYFMVSFTMSIKNFKGNQL